MEEDDSRVQIMIDVERWHLSYSWGIGEAATESIIPEHMRHGPLFFNALHLAIDGSAMLEFHDLERVKVQMSISEIDGPEPAAHDEERAKEFVGVGRAELQTTRKFSSLNVSSGLTRGALLALHHTLDHAEEARIDLLCRSLEPSGLKGVFRADVIRFSAGPRHP